MAKDIILLIGPRGSGKSSIGRRLADVLGYPFVDLDDEVLATFNEPTVTEVWAAHGEAAWRRAEAEVFAQLMEGRGQVIALGGGAAMIDAVRQCIRRGKADGQAATIYLSCPAPVLTRRLTDDQGDRPSLTGADPVDEIPVVLAARLATYEALADITCDTSDAGPGEIATALARELG